MDVMATVEKFKPILDFLLQNTMAAFDKTVREAKCIWRVWNVSSLIFKLSYIAYLIYALVAGVGNIYANVAFLAFSIAYLAFDLTLKAFESPLAKEKKKTVKHWFRIGKIGIDIVKVCMAVYAVVISWRNPSVVGVVLAVLSVFTLLLDIVLEIVYTIINSKLKLFKNAFEIDKANLETKVKEGAVQIASTLAAQAAAAVVERFTPGLIKKGFGFIRRLFSRKKKKVAELPSPEADGAAGELPSIED